MARWARAKAEQAITCVNKEMLDKHKPAPSREHEGATLEQGMPNQPAGGIARKLTGVCQVERSNQRGSGFGGYPCRLSLRFNLRWARFGGAEAHPQQASCRLIGLVANLQSDQGNGRLAARRHRLRLE